MKQYNTNIGQYYSQQDWKKMPINTGIDTLVGTYRSSPIVLPHKAIAYEHNTDKVTVYTDEIQTTSYIRNDGTWLPK